MPDGLPCRPDLVQRYALAITRRGRHAHQALQKAEAGLRPQSGAAGRQPHAAEGQQDVEGRRADVQRWAPGPSPSRHHLAPLSLTLPPCSSDDAPPDGGRGPPPAPGRYRRRRNVRPGPAVACTSRRHAARPASVACSRSTGGLLVGRRRAGGGAGRHRDAMEDMGPGVLAPRGLWGAPRGPHAHRAADSADAAGRGGGARRVAHACAAPAAAAPGS